MKHTFFAGLLALGLSSCTPTIVMNTSSTQTQEAAPRSMALECVGKSYGTLTSADASLSIVAQPDGTASGTFTNNKTIFQASGTGLINEFAASGINLQLNSRIAGGASMQLGFRSAGVGAGYGSTGTLTGSVNGLREFIGTFRGLQGSYRVQMSCQS